MTHQTDGTDTSPFSFGPIYNPDRPAFAFNKLQTTTCPKPKVVLVLVVVLDERVIVSPLLYLSLCHVVVCSVYG